MSRKRQVPKSKGKSWGTRVTPVWLIAQRLGIKQLRNEKAKPPTLADRPSDEAMTRPWP